MLGVVRANLMLVEEYGHMTPEIAATVLYASDVCESTIKSYPVTGDAQKRNRWMRQILEAWQEVGKDCSHWHPVVLTTMSLNVVEDLLDKIKARNVRESIEAIRDALAPLSYHFAGATEDEHAYFEDVDHKLNLLYALIGFER